MGHRILISIFGAFFVSGVVAACASSKSNSGFNVDDDSGAPGGGDGGGGSSSGGSSSGGSSGTLNNTDGGAPTPDGDVTVTTTIYANTDDSLYSMDPKTKAVTLIGKFAGTSGATADGNVTDVAVNAAGDVYVNTESVVYKAAVPASPGTVQLTKLASISLKQGQKFYALAFAPVGVLGAGEALVGGDGLGELWSIDASSGAIKDLGAFGEDPTTSGNVFALSGDIVFYNDSASKPTGLATIRSCKKGTNTCSSKGDFLASIDMTALANAFTSGTPAASLLAGIYGGTFANPGASTGYPQLFGLGVWEGDVYAFERAQKSTPSLLGIDTGTGKGSVVSSSFSFSNGWSGAGVTTKVTVTVPPPPPLK